MSVSNIETSPRQPAGQLTDDPCGVSERESVLYRKRPLEFAGYPYPGREPWEVHRKDGSVRRVSL
jgi:hypothetical protein